jgi:glycosyltransferase involved in cell wall biosynthesis
VTSDEPLSGVRIARIATVPFAAAQLKSQLSALAAAGADVTVVTSPGPELAQLGGPGIALHPIPIARSMRPWRDLVSLVRLIGLFMRERYDIVHSTTPKAGLVTAIAARLSGVRIRLHTFTGQPWATLHGPSAWVVKASEWLIGALSTRCYCDSAGQRDVIIESGIVPAERIDVLGAGSLAGVDLQRFSPDRFDAAKRAGVRTELGLAPDSKLAVFVGRVCRDKGIVELVKAFQGVLDAGIDADLLLIGPADDEIGRSGALPPDLFADSKRVHRIGFTAEPERYLAAADLHCLPSYREGFGTVVIEAAAFGVPTLGTNIYGLRDAVADGETGVLVPPRDAPALTAALIEMLRDDARRREMGRAARDRTLRLFAADHISALVIAEYRRLLAPWGARQQGSHK